MLQVGERVSIVCSPTERSAQGMQQGRFRPFGSGPPFTKPGQPLSATNHDTGREHALQPPPSSAAGIPGWVLPAAILFSASDAASGDSFFPKRLVGRHWPSLGQMFHLEACTGRESVPQ